MPATTELLKISDLLDAAARGIVGYRGALLDTRRGSVYDLTQGPPAILWSREVQRDRDLFRGVYVDTASEQDLDRLIRSYYQTERVREAFGTGTAILSRPTAAGGAGKIWAGTRIEIAVPGSPPTEFAVLQDTDYPASATAYPVPVRAAKPGTGTGATANAELLRITDVLFDATLYASYLSCDSGTNEELDADYVARARADRAARRLGFFRRIIDTCKAAGATNIVALDAGTFGSSLDIGISHVYVADANFVSTPSLIKACFLALDSVRVLGADLQVLGMTQTTLKVTSTVHLWDDPAKFNTTTLANDIRSALVDNFSGRADWWVFKTNELLGVIQRVSDAIEYPDVSTIPGEPSVGFPALLPRYTLLPTDISLTFTGPV